MYLAWLEVHSHVPRSACALCEGLIPVWSCPGDALQLVQLQSHGHNLLSL